jgi:hypothetical protein
MQKNRAVLVFESIVGSALLFSACVNTELPNANQLTPITCAPNQTQSCTCPDGRVSTQTCNFNIQRYGDCQCTATTANAGAGATGLGGSTGSAGSGSSQIAGADGTKSSSAAGSSAARGGAGAGAGGKGSAGAAGTAGKSNSSDQFDAERQICVDTINEYRATENLTPLKRAAPEVEACSDLGAKEDGDSGIPHGSARNGWTEFPGCSQYKSYFTGPLKGGQDACPGWPVGGNTAWGGYATIADALKGCLKSMWNEKTTFQASGKTREECQADQSSGGCFLTNGHYLNMSSTSYTAVSCGFYKMTNGNYWMNQDF